MKLLSPAWKPAKAMAKALGLRFPLSIAAIYEAGIQHGYGEDYDSITKIVERTNQAIGGSPATGIDEVKWLDADRPPVPGAARAPADRQAP